MGVAAVASKINSKFADRRKFDSLVQYRLTAVADYRDVR